MKDLSCPSCGGSVSFEERFAHVNVCPYCQSAIVFDEEVAKVMGVMSVLPSTSQKFGLGARAQYEKFDIEFVGRVRYNYSQGDWDEWFARLGNDQFLWISEDIDKVVLQREKPISEISQPAHELAVGDGVLINKTSYRVVEKDEAICQGGEGHLPFLVLPGESIHYMELKGEKGEYASLEVTPQGVHFFQGKVLSPDKIDVYMEAPPSLQDKASSSQTTSGKQILRYDGNRSLQIKCDQCGASNDEVDPTDEGSECQSCGSPLNIPFATLDCPKCSTSNTIFSESAREISCKKCQSSLSLSPHGNVELHPEKESSSVRFPKGLFLGAIAKIDNLPYRLVGRTRWVEEEEDDDTTLRYYSYGFLLYHSKTGYRWLTSYQGHYSLELPLENAPLNWDSLFNLSRKDSFFAEGKEFQFFERGEVKVDYVEGELPWVSAIGDKSNYQTGIAPPFQYDLEISKNELEASLSEYKTVSEVESMFGLAGASLNEPIGVGANEVIQPSHSAKFVALVTAVFLVLSIFLILKGSGKTILNTTVLTSDKTYIQEIQLPAKPIEIRFKGIPCKSFFSYEMKMINSENKISLNTTNYLGRPASSGKCYESSGYNWTPKQAGTYQLQIKPLLHSQQSVKLSIKESGLSKVPLLLFVALTGLSFLIAMVGIFSGGKEAQRWRGY